MGHKMVLIVLAFTALSFGSLVEDISEGAVIFMDTSNNCEHAIPSVKTDLAAIITDGFVHGRLTQTFVNPLETFLEAVYIFPMPENGAVHGMCVVTSEDVMWGKIKTRDEARAIYDSAKAQGSQAALLEQERPNVFTQSIANICPGETIQVIITYSAQLKYNMGTYEMAFPTTVGPRFNPPTGPTLQNPTYVPPGVRNGASLDIRILLLAGYEPENINSVSHEVKIFSAPSCLKEITSLGMAEMNNVNLLLNAKWIKLASLNELPNKDFVLRFDRRSKDLDFSFSFYKNPFKSDTGYFALTFFPSLTDTAQEGALEGTPLELVCMLDRSGSQNGAPMELARDLSLAMIAKLKPTDIFNVMSFANSVSKCFDASVPATQENIDRANAYLIGLIAGGGTMLKYAVDSTLRPPADPNRQKVVAFLTDGYIGNDQEVVSMIEANIGDIVLFSFGTGNSINRYLVEEMGRVGNGIGRVVTLGEDPAAVVDEFWVQVRAPQLSNINIDFGSASTFARIPETFTKIFDGMPITVLGQYTGSAATTVRITGKKNESDYSQSISVSFPSLAPINRSLPKIWAREKIRRIDLDNTKSAEVTQLGLDYSIMTAYTSFVAVADKIVNTEQEWTTAEIAALWPDGVDPLLGGGGTIIVSGSSGSPGNEDAIYALAGNTTVSRFSAMQYAWSPSADTLTMYNQQIMILFPPVFYADSLYQIQLPAYITQDTSIALHLQNAPSNMAVKNGIISWRPDSSNIGIDTMKVIITQALKSDTNAIILDVQPSISAEKKPENLLPTELSLNSSPNPFNPNAYISVGIPEYVGTAVRIMVFNMAGRMVKVWERKGPGYHTILWNGDDINGKQLGSGPYVIRLSAKNKSLQTKVLLLK
jgi:Ca-activated chloride channel family protein